MDVWQRSYRLLSDGVVLKRLLSGHAPTSAWAWQEFLRRYSKLFLKIIWQFEHDTDAVMEKYVYVCVRLADEEFARLRNYRPDEQATPPKLSTWLTVVVGNLCREQHRAVHGRRRLPRALAGLSDFDREVFKRYYWKGQTPEEIALSLETESERLQTSVAEALERIMALALRPSRTWRPLGAEPIFFSFDDQVHGGENGQSREEARFSEALLDTLPAEERLVVRLRFWEDLTAPEIARLLRWPSPRRVYTLLERALKTMRTVADQDEARARR